MGVACSGLWAAGGDYSHHCPNKSELRLALILIIGRLKKTVYLVLRLNCAE